MQPHPYQPAVGKETYRETMRFLEAYPAMRPPLTRSWRERCCERS